MKKSLKKLGEDGEALIGRFVDAKRTLVEGVYEEIKRTEPDLSDHGPRHIKNVLANIGHLLGDQVKDYQAVDLYCLGMVALFHDVGNIYGRERHHEKIQEIYHHVRGADDPQEKLMVIRAARAHTGKAADGTRDTLKDLEEYAYFREDRVRLREIAAILRLADELAEGPQRTSKFLLQTMGYDEKSRIYHRYAATVRVNIDRPAGKLALTYHVRVTEDGPPTEEQIKATRELLEFCYRRIVKLDQERKYCRFYCDKLAPFARTTAKFYFHVGHHDYDCGLPEIVLDDKVIPGDGPGSVVALYPTFELDRITRVLVEQSQHQV